MLCEKCGLVRGPHCIWRPEPASTPSTCPAIDRLRSRSSLFVAVPLGSSDGENPALASAACERAASRHRKGRGRRPGEQQHFHQGLLGVPTCARLAITLHRNLRETYARQASFLCILRFVRLLMRGYGAVAMGRLLHTLGRAYGARYSFRSSLLASASAVKVSVLASKWTSRPSL